MFSARLDSLLAGIASAFATGKPAAQFAMPCRQVTTPVGAVRLYDSAPDDFSKPCVVFVPDGPNVIEHHLHLFALLTPHLRVVCFDMPGFGFSAPAANYTHALDQGAAAVVGVLDGLHIPRAWLAFSCANGFYAIRVAQVAASRVAGLFLTQTPALRDMAAWTHRVVPSLLRTPVLGQLIVWLQRKRLARSWYQIALPRGSDAGAYQATARQALDAGGCFCLAGVVQGLEREIATDMSGVGVPCTLIWGERDHSHKHTDPASLLQDLPHAKILRFADCGHFSDLEQSERYAELLLTEIGRARSNCA